MIEYIKYRKKPVVVNALELTKENVEQLALSCAGMIVEEIDSLDPTIRFVGINVPTVNGVQRASEGDYIVQGSKGEFYIYKPEYFKTKFEMI